MTQTTSAGIAITSRQRTFVERIPMQSFTSGHRGLLALRRIAQHPLTRAMLPIGIAAAAIFGVIHMSSGMSVAQIHADARAYPIPTLAIAIGAMALSYFFLAFYDALILPTYSDVKIPTPVLMMTGSSSLAVSNLFGFSWLTGGSIRFKIYASYGVGIGAIAKLMATSWAAFFSGLWALIGAVMVAYPSGFSDVFAVSPQFLTFLGAAMLSLVCWFFYWTRTEVRSLGFGQIRLAMPRAREGMLLTAVTILELIATALVLYVLLPEDLANGFGPFVGIFAVSVGLGILSHSPGGLGVFEVTMITCLGALGRSDVMAAIALYRVIYTVLPASISLVGLAVAWLYVHRDSAKLTVQACRKSLGPFVPILAATLAFLSGSVLMLSGTLPADPVRLGFLRRLLPLEIIETSHLIGSICGVLLAVVALGLYRRMYRAWLLTMALVGIGLLASLLKGYDWEEASALAVALALLWSFRSSFYRASILKRIVINTQWIFTVCALVTIITWIGFFANSHIEHTNALWWEFGWNGEASRLLRGTLVSSVILIAILLNGLLSKQSTRLKPEPIPDVVVNLSQMASNATSGLALTGDKRFLITPDEKAFLAYADTGKTLICKGDPVGEIGACIAVIWQLRELADKMGRRCAFYGVSQTYLPTFLDLGQQILKIGEVARVNLHHFSLDGPKRKHWRNARARMQREGYYFEVLPAGSAGSVLEDLHTVSDAWLKEKNGHEKGFSLGWFDLAYLNRFDLGVLRKSSSDQIVAFANIMKAGDQSEIFVDLMRYQPDGPPRAMDALFTELMLWGKEKGFAYFSLGGSPLSGLHAHPLACTWHKIGRFLYRNGDTFYKFDGLRQFKQKFDPEWSSEYLTTTGKWGAAKVLLEVSQLISKGAPVGPNLPARKQSITTPTQRMFIPAE